jgi:hypothetical protein
MDRLQDIFRAIDADGFKESTLFVIDEYINDILYGRKDFNGFTLSEHAGLCKGGAPLIGASIIASYARRSLTTGSNVEGREGGPANWEIDEYQEKLLEQWAKAARLWIESSNMIIKEGFGPMIAQGAEAIVAPKDKMFIR